jgi:hypothetical protein
MGKKKKKKLKGSIKFDPTPVTCRQCKYHRVYMRKVKSKKIKNWFISQYVCTLCNNDIPEGVTDLIPKWCPKGYKNIYFIK